METDNFTEVRECSVKKHSTQGSIYPKDSVPAFLFIDQKTGKSYKCCLDCRLYGRKLNIRHQQKTTESVKESLDRNTGVIMCLDSGHSNKGSHFPRNSVPTEMFRKNMENPKSILVKTCIDCREYQNALNRERRNLKKEESESKGLFYCTNCSKELPLLDRATNRDKTYSTLCNKCKIGEKTRRINLVGSLRKIKLEFIQNYQSCCYICGCLFISNPTKPSAIKLQPVFINGVKSVEYEGIEYPVAQFIVDNHDKFETNILQFDHLSEIEQRERGMLLDHEKYIPKRCIVSKASSESAMRLEAKKCQLLCAKCHVIITMAREKGFAYNSRSHAERKKLEYILGVKSIGCSVCGYKNDKLPRFFDFDHIDPSSKRKELSRMVKDDIYTLDDVVSEILKCRVLCHHCHIIHTQNQIDKGTVTNKKRVTETNLQEKVTPTVLPKKIAESGIKNKSVIDIKIKLEDEELAKSRPMLSMTELKQMAEDNYVVGYAHMNKGELIRILSSYGIV